MMAGRRAARPYSTGSQRPRRRRAGWQAARGRGRGRGVRRERAGASVGFTAWCRPLAAGASTTTTLRRVPRMWCVAVTASCASCPRRGGVLTQRDATGHVPETCRRRRRRHADGRSLAAARSRAPTSVVHRQVRAAPVPALPACATRLGLTLGTACMYSRLVRGLAVVCPAWVVRCLRRRSNRDLVRHERVAASCTRLSQCPSARG